VEHLFSKRFGEPVENKEERHANRGNVATFCHVRQHGDNDQNRGLAQHRNAFPEPHSLAESTGCKVQDRLGSFHISIERQALEDLHNPNRCRGNAESIDQEHETSRVTVRLEPVRVAIHRALRDKDGLCVCPIVDIFTREHGQARFDDRWVHEEHHDEEYEGNGVDNLPFHAQWLRDNGERETEGRDVRLRRNFLCLALCTCAT
jgi:hypothetical protein